MSAGLSTGGRVAIGPLELVSLPDAVGILGELDELYPDVPADAWDPYRALYPELFDGSRWHLPVACFLIRAGDRTILVDAGVGPPGSWDWDGEQEGHLAVALAAQGLDPADLDCVFLTHLHVDHVGWLADDAFAPQARHPGHLGLHLESGSERAVLLVDAAVHPALLDRPDWRYVSDLDHEPAAATRRALVAELADTDTLIAAAHYPGSSIGRIVRRGQAVVWEEVA